MRAGAHLLLMATNPTNRGILRSALDRPLETVPGSPHRVSPGGREMLFVAFVAERWLQSSPRGPMPFDSQEAEAAVAALAEGWSTTVVHMLAREPLTFSELLRATDGPSGRTLKRQLAAMQRAGQVEALPGGSARATYALTDWLRAGIAPLIASARLERRIPRQGLAPIDALDVEAGFRLSLPLFALPRELSGACRLGLNLADDESSRLTGVTAHIDEGLLVSCASGLDNGSDAWAAASAADWLDTVIEPGAKQVRTGGDRWLARALLEGLHEALFGIPVA
jgi:DNA-binding HxlR family transcriptional regulator